MTTLVRLALTFVAAEIAGLRLTSFAPLALGAAALMLMVALRARAGRSGFLVAFALLGYAVGSTGGRSARGDCRRHIPDGADVRATAAVDGPLVSGASVRLHLEHVRIEGATVGCAKVVRARLPASVPVSAPHVALSGSWWSRRRSTDWPEGGEDAGTLTVRVIQAADATHGHPLLRMRNGALTRVRAQFRADSAMVEAILLAQRGAIDTAVRGEFAAAGMAHLLAISGAHVGILAAAVLLLARAARLRARAAAIAAAAFTFGYVGFLGAPPAAARAALQGVALLWSRMAQRPADAYSLLALAGLVLVVADPLAPLDAGFQLSFAGVFGLLSFRSAMRSLMPGSWPAPIRESWATGFAATVATAPIAAWHFGIVSFIGPFANLLAVPLLAAAIPAAGAALAAGALHEPAGLFLAGGAEILLRLLRGVARISAAVPAGHAWVASDTVTAGLAAALTFLLASAGWSEDAPRRLPAPVRRSRVILRLGMAGAAFVLWPVLRPGANGELEIHAIDVGQGDAYAIRTPRGRWLLVDAGPATPRFDAGRDRVVPYLRRRGVDRIDLLVLTHPDADHIGGAASVRHAFRVALVADPAAPTGKGPYVDLLASARRDGTTWVAARAGREVRFDDVLIRVLAPEDPPLDASFEANDLSVVLRLQYGRFSALFLGDAPRRIENGLVARYGPALASDVIKVGHHGSRTSTGDSLLGAVQPRVALISAGRRNRYGHPAPEVIDRLRRYGVTIARTDVSGTIVVRGRSDGAMTLGTAR